MFRTTIVFIVVLLCAVSARAQAETQTYQLDKYFTVFGGKVWCIGSTQVVGVRWGGEVDLYPSLVIDPAADDPTILYYMSTCDMVRYFGDTDNYQITWRSQLTLCQAVVMVAFLQADMSFTRAAVCQSGQ